MGRLLTHIPDLILALIGLALMGYGLWLYCPWVSYAVVGAVMLALGVFPSSPPKREVK